MSIVLPAGGGPVVRAAGEIGGAGMAGLVYANHGQRGSYHPRSLAGGRSGRRWPATGRQA